MWFILAFVSFLTGVVYLFRCLRKLDALLERQEEKGEVLSLAFSEPSPGTCGEPVEIEGNL